jgi:PAS domain S-box-containing protein
MQAQMAFDQGVSAAEIVGGLDHFGALIRLHLGERLTKRSALFAALAQLDAGLSLLRRCYLEAHVALHRERPLQAGHMGVLAPPSTESKKVAELFQGLFESAPDAMVMVNKGGKIVLVNAQTERLFGYRRENLLGQSVEILVPERFRDRHTGYRLGYVGEPHTRPMGVGLELGGQRQDGSEFPIEISLGPVEVATEEGLLVAAAIRDITERKRLEEEVREAVSRTLVGQMLRDLQAVGGLSEGAMFDAGQKLVANTGAETLQQCLHTFTAMGLGTLSLVETDEHLRRWVFSGDGLVECRDGSGQPTCHYTRGFLCGVMAHVLGGAQVAGVEVACQSMADPVCRFVFQVVQG